MPHTQGNNSLMGEEYLKPTELPNKQWCGFWDEIVIDDRWRRSLENYASLFLKHELKDYSGSGVLLFQGPPGTGKTTLAKGFANFIANKVKRKTMVYEVKAASWRSFKLGQTSQFVEYAFNAIQLSARHFPTILIVDELETIAISRKRTLGSTEPSDVISAVDELLKQVDRMQQEQESGRGVLIIATSNLVHAIDEAVLSRVDLQIPFVLPDKRSRIVILKNKIDNLRSLGHVLNESEIQQIADDTEGFSGRELSKLPLRVKIGANGQTNLTAEDYQRVIKEIEGDRNGN